MTETEKIDAVNPNIQRVLNIQKQFDNVTYQMYNHKEIFAAHGLALLLVQFKSIEIANQKQLSDLRGQFTLNNYDLADEQDIQFVYGTVAEAINLLLKDTNLATPRIKQTAKIGEIE
jgi:hypothetical protein